MSLQGPYRVSARLRSLLERILECASAIQDMGSDDVIFVFTHIDADGICGGAIIVDLLIRMNKPFIMRFIPQIIPGQFEEYWNQIDPRYAIFIDLGTTGIVDLMRRTRSLKLGIVIDHHITRPDMKIYPRIHVVNPRNFGFDGGVEVSSSVMAYLTANMYSKFIPNLKRMVKCAVIGALGDSQDVGHKRRLIGLNRIVADDGVKMRMISEREDLLLIGRGIKPLYRLLAESYALEIPGVTGSYEAAMEFLVKNQIVPEGRDPEGIFLDDIPIAKKQLLKRKIIEALMVGFPGRYTIESIEDMLLGTIYEFRDETIRQLRYARDMAILLNAAGKLKNPQVGLRILLEKDKRVALEKAMRLYDRYRAFIANALKYSDEKIEWRGRVAIYHGVDTLTEELASTVSSILAASLSGKADVVMVTADSIGDMVKVSIRKPIQSRISNVYEVLRRTVDILESASGGGHESAAGAYVERSDLDRFVDMFCRLVNIE